jgi:protein SCO1/2
MTTRSLRLSIGVGILALGVGAPAFSQMAPSSVPPKGLPPALQNVGFDPQLDAELPLDLPFTDEAARSVRMGDYFGHKPVVLAFVYYDCPMLCNQVEESLVGALKMISFTVGREYEVVFVSFDPRETPDMAAEKKARALEHYARPESTPGWHFLTGSPESVAALTRAANFRYTFDQKTKLFAHASGILVLTPQGRISRYFFGIDYPPRDLRLGLVEASANKIGTPADRLVLFCYQYDPSAAKYSATILGLVRLAGVVTVLAILIGVIAFRRREARTSRARLQGA